MKQHPIHTHLFLAPDGFLYIKLIPTRDSAGYEMVTVPFTGAGRKTPVRQRSHRLIWECSNGVEVPAGRVVRHKNDVKSDNRPENLEVGTQAQNCLDTVRNGNTTKGENNAQAKLTAADVLIIRERRAGGESLQSIAKDHNVNISTICDIDKRRTWKHLK